MTDDLPGPHGPLASVLAVRSRTGILEHREALVYTLGKAAELEHLVMLQYLFAAFSLKQTQREGLSSEAVVAVDGWRKTLLEIAEQADGLAETFGSMNETLMERIKTVSSGSSSSRKAAARS